MPKVTNIEKQKKEGRLNVYIDGVFMCGMDEFTALKNRVREGAEFTPERLKEIALESDTETALSKAYAAVNKRMRTEKQMRLYLKEKQYPQNVVDTVIDKLLEHKYLDDRAYAETFISCKRKQWGKKRIVMELKADGVPVRLIDEVYDETDGQSDEAFELAQKYARQKGGFDRAKTYNFLYAKGFLNDEIFDAINRMKECENEEDN